MPKFSALSKISSLILRRKPAHPVPLFPEKSVEQAFTDNYLSGEWGRNQDGEGFSGSGSTLENTKLYRQLLKDFLKALNIRTVVDVGCGDWTFSQHVDWNGIHYVGYDVVKYVIEKNNRKFGSPTIQFFHGNAINEELQPADLLICKDVLQHLSNPDIVDFIPQIKKFKYCLITNDVDPENLSSKNHSIHRGAYRTIDLLQPPFNLKAYKILHYPASEVTKQVLLVIN